MVAAPFTTLAYMTLPSASFRVFPFTLKIIFPELIDVYVSSFARILAVMLIFWPTCELIGATVNFVSITVIVMVFSDSVYSFV